ncbi:MAG: hypothetical protein AAFP87_09755 [Pseudomonadota bacterium]
MLGLALIGLLGVALVVNLVDDDDDAPATSEDAATLEQGSEGDDLIETAAGDDTVFADAGDDVLLLGDGNDRAFGEEGEDIVIGGAGDDFLRGSADDDMLYGDAGEDTLFGDVGNDLLDGTDILDTDALFAAAQEAVENGTVLTEAEFLSFFDFDNETGEADTLNGGVGSDILIAGSNDVVTTGTGQDEVDLGEWITPGEPAVITDFKLGKDSLVFSYEGDAPPNVFLTEQDDGTVTVETDEGIVAILQGLDFQDVQNAGLTIQFVPFG